MDGNLLRKRLFGCDKRTNILIVSCFIRKPNENLYHSYVRSPLAFQYDESDPCREFSKAARMMYRTHYFILEYQYNVYMSTDIVLATQCSIERVPLLEQLSKHWPGTISVALYLTDAEVQNFLVYVRGSPELRKRKNIAYHIVYKEGV